LPGTPATAGAAARDWRDASVHEPSGSRVTCRKSTAPAGPVTRSSPIPRCDKQIRRSRRPNRRHAQLRVVRVVPTTTRRKPSQRWCGSTRPLRGAQTSLLDQERRELASSRATLVGTNSVATGIRSSSRRSHSTGNLGVVRRPGRPRRLPCERTAQFGGKTSRLDAGPAPPSIGQTRLATCNGEHHRPGELPSRSNSARNQRIRPSGPARAHASASHFDTSFAKRALRRTKASKTDAELWPSCRGRLRAAESTRLAVVTGARDNHGRDKVNIPNSELMANHDLDHPARSPACSSANPPRRR